MPAGVPRDQVADGVRDGFREGRRDAGLQRYAEAVAQPRVHVHRAGLPDEDVRVEHDLSMYFGGVGASGTGSRHGGAQANIDAFTETRWITMRREPGQYPL